MEKLSLKMIFVFVIVAVFVVGILTYVSILGENHKINKVIVDYFNNLKDGKYLEVCKDFSSNVQDERFSSTVRPLAAAIARLDDDFEAGQLDERIYQQKRKALKARIQEILDNFNFLLELSLLQHYNLIDHHDYKVELQRSHFWIPIISDDSVRVSVALRKKGHKGVADALSRGQSRELTHDLIVVGREKGAWKIRRFDIDGSSLADIYNDMQQTIDLNKYATMTPDGFRLKNATINFETLTPIDKRLLRFSLHKIQQLLDPPDKKDKGASPRHPSL